MASWENYDSRMDEQQQRDFVLKKPSTVGPWVALGLGITVIAFVGYLMYVNMLLPPAGVTSAQRLTERRKAAVTVRPQGRAPHALLGGGGPALPPE